jgi:hypothetical protein
MSVPTSQERGKRSSILGLGLLVAEEEDSATVSFSVSVLLSNLLSDGDSVWIVLAGETTNLQYNSIKKEKKNYN